MTTNENRKSRRLIFLDIDGVLNSTRSFIAYGEMPNPMDPKTWKYFDQVAVNLIKNIVNALNALNAEVVLSSSWLRYVNLSNLSAYLDIEIKEKIDLNIEPNNRGKCIEAYLEDIISDVDSYVIIDDIPTKYLTKHQLKNRRIVTTNYSEGFSFDNYLYAIDALLRSLSMEEIEHHLPF